MVPTDSKLDVTDMDRSLSSVTTLVFDPGGSYVKDMNIDFSTFATDFFMFNTDRLA